MLDVAMAFEYVLSQWGSKTPFQGSALGGPTMGYVRFVDVTDWVFTLPFEPCWLGLIRAFQKVSVFLK